MEGRPDPPSAGPAGIPDEFFARVAVQRKLAELGALRECLELVRCQPPAERQPLSTVMIREGVLARQDVEAVEEAVRTGAVRDQRVGRYEILGMIGEGGMGAVYAAADIDTLEFCALKILPKELAEDADIVRRFLQEAETACTLRHTNIVGGLRVGEDRGVHFFSMEFVDGVTVYDRLESEGVLPEGESLRIVRGTCLGLQYASEKGLVHRDIKPENIMIDRDGTPKLLDMGLVKRLDASRATRLTQTGMAIGTPHYISPEQARGEEEVDARSDIYALGATLYHMVTGQVPFEGNTAAVIMTKHLSEELDYPSDVNPHVSEHTSRLVTKMMAKERHDRYTRPKDVVADIDLILTGRAPSGVMLPPGASSIRQAVQIERAKRKAKRAGITSVHARIEKRERGGLQEALGRARKPLIYAAGVLVVLNVIFLILFLATRPARTGTAPDEEEGPGAAAAEPRGAPDVGRLVANLRSVDVERLPALLDSLPDAASLSPEEARKLADAVREAEARFDAEADRRLGEAIERASRDSTSHEEVAEELRRLLVMFARSRVRPRIEEALARLYTPPAPAKPRPPEIRPVELVARTALQGWRSYGDWSVDEGSLVFRYDPARKYDRAVQSHLGFGEFRLTAEIRTEGGTRAEIAVWEQSMSDRRSGSAASSALALAKGDALEAARGAWAPLEVDADPRRFKVRLGGRELPTHVEGPLRNGRIRFSLTDGTWRIRDLRLMPVVAEGDAAYDVSFLEDGHRWQGARAEGGLSAVRTKGVAWASVEAGPGGEPLFTVAEGMRMSFVFRAERIRDLYARIESPDGGSWQFRLSGRPPEGQWTALTVRLADFCTTDAAAPPAGARITKMSVGAGGEGPGLVLSSLRVVSAASAPDAGGK